MLNGVNIPSELTDQRGLDHGAWIPLRIMYPDANIPVIQMSIPVPRTPDLVYRMGQALAPLRDQNILLMGSGNLTHNLPYAFQQMQTGKITLTGDNPVDKWARESDEWIKAKLDDLNMTDILASPEKLPNFDMAAPTTEHFDPVYFTLGSLSEGEGVNHFHEGFQGGSISMRSFSLEN